MKERPILFNGDMVRAILDGRKTQTRRIAKPQPDDVDRFGNPMFGERGFMKYGDPCPLGIPGDRLWVRESWVPPHQNDCGKMSPLCYRSTNPDPSMLRWKPSIHMPRWASRITLEIVSVRVERLAEISASDAKAEGYDGSTFVPGNEHMNCRAWFHGLWNSVYGDGAFEQNPWVWVVEFKRVEDVV